jgi:hypothetical protein
VVRPAQSASVRLHVDRTLLENNSNGIIADSTLGTGFIRAVIRDSAVIGNTNNGVLAQAGAVVNLLLSNVASQSNTYGLSISGANATMLVDRSQVTANAVGLTASGGAKLLSYGNNNVNLNNTDGVFTGPVALK